MDLPEDWTCDSNKVVKVHLDSADFEHAKITLLPKFTYAIFGEVERIFGYKDLSVDITIASDSLLPLLEIRWGSRLETSQQADSEDLESLMRDYLAPDVQLDRNTWEAARTELSESFAPHGECVKEYTVEGEKFAIYKASLSDRSFAQDLERMQIFSILFIEGASLIDAEDDRFDVFVTYAVDAERHYRFVGYCTCYKFFFFDRLEHSFEHIRYRISQFIILPCDQGAGHGGQLYDAIAQYCLQNPLILEITVEDPSESFDDLRDRRDLLRLCSDQAFLDSAHVLPPTKTWLRVTQRRLKLSSRQFARLVEMSCLDKLNVTDRQQIKSFRLLVKSRLYMKNRHILAELSRAEMLAKLEETYQTQKEDYRRLLNGLRGRPKDTSSGSAAGTRGSPSIESGTNTNGHKRRRI